MLNISRDTLTSNEPGSLMLRLATPDDAAVLARAAAAFFRDTFGDANTATDMDAYVAEAFSESRQRAELSAVENRIVLAVDAHADVAGYVHVRLDAHPALRLDVSIQRPAEIARLYAARGWHGHGLGARLMNAAVATARESGADVLWLGVWQRNARAVAFYEKHGFHIVGMQEFVLGSDRQRDHVMARRLTSDAE
jgi:ribosomal protein S18 acetylase RimI-like enzyme